MAEATKPLTALYEALAALAQRQLDALQAGEVESFLALAEARDATFSSLQAREGEAQGLQAGDRAAIRQTIIDLLARDLQIEQALTSLDRERHDELATLHTGVNALHAYMQEAQQGAYFIDRNS